MTNPTPQKKLTKKTWFLHFLQKRWNPLVDEFLGEHFLGAFVIIDSWENFWRFLKKRSFFWSLFWTFFSLFFRIFSHFFGCNLVIKIKKISHFVKKHVFLSIILLAVWFFNIYKNNFTFFYFFRTFLTLFLTFLNISQITIPVILTFLFSLFYFFFKKLFFLIKFIFNLFSLNLGGIIF